MTMTMPTTMPMQVPRMQMPTAPTTSATTDPSQFAAISNSNFLPTNLTTKWTVTAIMPMNMMTAIDTTTIMTMMLIAS